MAGGRYKIEEVCGQTREEMAKGNELEKEKEKVKEKDAKLDSSGVDLNNSRVSGDINNAKYNSTNKNNPEAQSRDVKRHS